MERRGQWDVLASVGAKEGRARKERGWPGLYRPAIAVLRREDIFVVKLVCSS